MGCSTSKLDDEEAVQLCKDRKKFIQQAVEHRTKFASGHLAYIQAMKRVSNALRDYIDGDDPREFSFTTPTKKTAPGFISITPDSFSVEKSDAKPSYTINYFRSGGNSSVSVEERPPQSPDTYHVEAYSHFGMESVFGVQSSSLGVSPNEDRRSYHPHAVSASSSSSQWDFFWNPFSSLDYYNTYDSSRSGLDRVVMDDENAIREEEGIPELEEETEHEEEIDKNENNDFDHEHDVVVEDVTTESDDDDVETDSGDEGECCGVEEDESKEVAKAQCTKQVSKKESADCVTKEETETTPGFTVYVNKRHTSMAEVVKDLEDQFIAACKAAGEMSSILEAGRAHYSSSNSSSNDLTAMKMLNPVALFRSGSSRSSSSRFVISSGSTSRDERYESSSDFSEESSLFSGSHQSTLDRLYAWEKKLYLEVRAGERVRRAYEKKCAQLRNQDVKGEDPSFVDKTQAAIRDLHTRIKVSIHSVEAVSKRIETLRDEELEPQLLELVQGLARMWKAMAECHRVQKRTLDEAKILLAGTPSRIAGTTQNKYTIMSPSEPHKLARSAANLEAELRNWRNCFDSWIVSQREYVRDIKGWLLRCLRSDSGPFSPRRSMGAPPIFDICIRWARFLDGVSEAPVLDGMDFFAAGVGSVYAERRLREETGRVSGGSRRFGGEIVEVGGREEEEEVLTAEKMSEVAIRVVCAGMSVAVSAMTEFAAGSAEGYAGLVECWESGGNGKGELLEGETSTRR